MKQFYDNATTLATENRVRLEANYNKTIYGMHKPRDIIFYKAPGDPSEHPMYVDAEGRNVPVDPNTLQPMTNEIGRIVDINGVEVPQYELLELPNGTRGYGVHIDDVRVAVASTDFSVKNEEDEDVYIAYDGTIIPNNEFGYPNTTMIGDVAWAIGDDGEPYAPIDRVFSFKSYTRPVRAENVPVDASGNLTEIVEDSYPDYFSLESIVEAYRPSRRGVQVAWTSPDGHDMPVYTGNHVYDKPRFYTASSERPYKYWLAPLTSDATPTVMASLLSLIHI